MVERSTARTLMALLALTSCQSYEPSPLEPRVHRATWHARTLDDASLAEFVERLDVDFGGAPARFDPADGLTLREGRLVALVFHPDLRLARLGVARAAASADEAGLWPDPELSVSALRITESVSDRWVVTPGLAFTIPLSGRLGAERELADAEQRAAVQRALEAEWGVWHDVERAWFAWSAAGIRVDETERLLAALETLVERTAALVRQGELLRTEAALFGVEEAQRRNQLVRLRGEKAALEQRLRAQLGLAPEAPVAFVPTLAPLSGTAAADGQVAARTLAERNPGLARLSEEYDAAEATLRREIEKQIPDLTLGPQYETDQGQSRIGLFGGLPLPFLNANRRAIAEALVDRERARAAFESEYETLVGRWTTTAARARALADQRVDLETALIPLVDRQVADALLLTGLGEGTSLVLLESLTRAHETKLALIETRAAEALASAELEHLTGPLVPDRKTETDEEDR